MNKTTRILLGIVLLGLTASSGAAGTSTNYFTTLIGKSRAQTDAKLQAAFEQYFLKDDPAGATEQGKRLYFPKGADEAVIWSGQASGKDFYVITEGQSYGMMIAVQMNRQDLFDRLWRFVKRHVQYPSGDRKGYTCWKALGNGTCGKNPGNENPATDGEEYFATALLFASSRWGNAGSINYEAEAQALLDLMRTGPGKNATGITAMFDARTFLPVFSPIGAAADFTLPAYNLPAFFEIWAARAKNGKDFWRQAAEKSRAFHAASFDPRTGLSPYMARFDGKPYKDGPDFNDDSSRAIMNLAMDQVWFGKNPGAPVLADRLLGFFYKEGVKNFKQEYTLAGRPKVAWQATSTVAMAATGAMISTLPVRKEFVQRFWDTPVPEGKYRYFNGLMYMLAMLNLSGSYQIY